MCLSASSRSFRYSRAGSGLLLAAVPPFVSRGFSSPAVLSLGLGFLFARFLFWCLRRLAGGALALAALATALAGSCAEVGFLVGVLGGEVVLWWKELTARFCWGR